MKKLISATLVLVIITIALLYSMFSTNAIASGRVYTSDVYVAMATGTTGLPVEWRLARNGTEVIITDYIIGTLSDTGGSIKFAQSGQYTLTAVITDAAGREFAATSDVTVYPIPNLSFEITSIGYINIPVEVNTSFTDVANKVLWSLTRNGESVALSDYTAGTLTDSGGSITFTAVGDYELTATMTDVTDRTFSETRNINIDKDLNCDFKIQSTNLHISKSIVATIDTGTYTGGKNIEWTLTRSGSAASYTGSLENNGGSINVSVTGSYILKASITDNIGRVTTCSKSFTIYNNSPNTPVITRIPSTPIVDREDLIKITANTNDPDGDSVTLIWENRTNETQKYALGQNIVRVKAVDQWGAESSWGTEIFTCKVLTEQQVNILGASSGIDQFFTIPSDATAVNVTFIIEVDVYVNYSWLSVKGRRKDTGAWDDICNASPENGRTFSFPIVNYMLYDMVYSAYGTTKPGMYPGVKLTTIVKYEY